MSSESPIGISMLGCGTVGRPLLRRLLDPSHGLRVRAIVVGDPSQPRHADLRSLGDVTIYSSEQFDASGGRIVYDDPATHIVVEVIGGSRNPGGQPPYEKTRDRLLGALMAGKHVVTANKTVVSYWGPDLFDAADENGVNITFEAAVAGSIPIIRLLRDHWQRQRIEKVVGILNGTCNYILSLMPHFRGANIPMPSPESLGRKASKSDYPADRNGAQLWALDHARAQGLAEADPSFDLDGHDAAQKLAILASLAFDTFIPPTEENIPRSSIRPVTLEDIVLAKALGFVIKPLAVARREGDRVELRVHPCLLPRDHALCNVSGADNAVYLESEKVGASSTGFGEQLYSGKGAGGEPTATALFSDILDVADRIRAGVVRNPHYHRSGTSIRIAPGDEQTSRGYIKSISRDVPGVFMNKTRILYGTTEAERINIHQIYNLHQFQRDDLVPDVITILPTAYRHVRKALKGFVDEGVVEEEPLFLRIEE